MSSRFKRKSCSSAAGVAFLYDDVLDLVDRVTDPVGEWEVAIDQVIGDRP
jgi:hypothetical protein